MRILFVCTGNSCRSPMAELYFEELCRKAGRDDIDVRSAGTCAWDGGRISAPAAAVMRQLGIERGTIRYARHTQSHAADNDLIVAMTGRCGCCSKSSAAATCPTPTAAASNTTAGCLNRCARLWKTSRHS